MKFRKHISAVLAACILAGSCITPTAFADTALLYGDTDQSGEVDVSDAVLVARFYVGDWTARITDRGLEVSDVNLDGDVDNMDLIQIIRYIAGLDVKLGVAEERIESNYNAVNMMQNIEPAEVKGKEADSAFIESQLALTANLLRETSSRQTAPDNLLISPLSISQALAMTANGAKGQTLSEMEKLLGGDADIDALNQYYYGYTSALPSEKKASFHLANSIWIRDNENMIQVPEAFLQTNANYYGAGAFRAPFDASTVLDINNWVKFHTHDMIPKLVDSLDPQTAMVLINALAFEADWMHPYEDDRISDGKFTLSDGTTIEVPMMYSEEYGYIEDEWATGFIKKYSGGNYSFAAILPKESKSVTISDYIGMMDAESLQKLLKSRSDEPVDTAMPKFKFSYDTSLAETLKALGMETAFSMNDADFSGLNTAPGQSTYIDDVLHKTFIQVDERGTRAGAVTAVLMKATAVMDKPKEVFLNRPFLFMIFDEKTQLPIFIGYVLDPTKTGE